MLQSPRPAPRRSWSVPLIARVLLGAAWVAGALGIAIVWGLNANPQHTATDSLVAHTPDFHVPAPVVLRAVNETASGHRLRLPLAASVSHSLQPAATPEDSALLESEPAEDAGEAPASVSRFILPLAQWSYVTDRFGAHRGSGLVHEGIDLALIGHLVRSPIYASCGGAVSLAQYSQSYGYHVVVDCGEGWTTLYAHMSRMAVRPGQRVAQGAVLGYTGSTGVSTGEHLHFEILYRGTPVNPEHHLDFKIPPGTPISTGPLWSSSRGAGGTDATGSSPRFAPTPVPTPVPTTAPTPTATPVATPAPSPTTASATPTLTPDATPTEPPLAATPTVAPAPASATPAPASTPADTAEPTRTPLPDSS